MACLTGEFGSSIKATNKQEKIMKSASSVPSIKYSGQLFAIAKWAPLVNLMDIFCLLFTKKYNVLNEID